MSSISGTQSSAYLGNFFNNISNSFAKRLSAESQEKFAASTARNPNQTSTARSSGMQGPDPAESKKFFEAVDKMQASVSDKSLPGPPSSSPSAMELEWSMPPCMGIELFPTFGSEAYNLAKDYPEEYQELQKLSGARRQGVREKFELDGLTQTEYYFKTRGEQSAEMTQDFYDGFDERGKELINFFYPEVAKKYGL